MPRVLVLAGVWPHVRANVEAANVVLHEMLLHLVAEPAFAVAFVRIAADADGPPPAGNEALRELEASGLTVLESVLAKEPLRPDLVRRLVSRYIAASPRALLPGAANAPELRARCEEWRADCALSVWCDTAPPGLHDLAIPRMAYHGDPFHTTASAQSEFDWAYRPRAFDPRLFVTTMKARIGVAAIKRAHLKVMRRFDAVGDVSANYAGYYLRHGVHAFYIHNMWPSAAAPDWETKRDRSEQQSPLKIVANVGSLSATGNTRGLYMLATSVLPALKRTLGEGQFELHVFGNRTPHRYLAPLLDDPHIRVRGFVDDLDAEILSAPVFLVTNNHTEFKVGNTRFLHAWSLGGCVVTFGGSAEGLPELAHRRNALLAATPDEMAALVAEAAGDKSLRRALGHAGAELVATQFDPASVTRVVADRIAAITAGRVP